MRRARSTATLAMLTVPAPIDVSVRTRLATVKALLTQRPSIPFRAPAASAASYASFTCPRICGSPSTIDSRLAATRKTWVTASSPRLA